MPPFISLFVPHFLLLSDSEMHESTLKEPRGWMTSAWLPSHSWSGDSLAFWAASDVNVSSPFALVRMHDVPRERSKGGGGVRAPPTNYIDEIYFPRDQSPKRGRRVPFPPKIFSRTSKFSCKQCGFGPLSMGSMGRGSFGRFFRDLDSFFRGA